MKKSILLLEVCFCVCVFLLYHNFVPDDTFIHIGYAKSILAGKGYTFAGNRTYGSTAPLWPPLIALASLVFHNIVFSARFLSIAFSAVSVALIYFVARMRYSRSASFVAAVLLAGNSYFIRWSLTGMESTASVFFMLFLVFILYREEDGSPVPAALYLFLGLSPLVRPEFYLFLAIFWVYLVLKKGPLIGFLKPVLCAIPTVGWLAFAKSYYGTIVPTTFLAKADEPFFTVELSTIRRLLELFFSGNPAEIVFIFTSVIVLFFYSRKEAGTSEREPAHDILLFAIMIASFYSFYGLKDVLVISRYSIMLVPLVILVTIDLIGRVLRASRASIVKERLLWGGLLAAALTYSVVFTWLVVKPAADRFYEGFQDHYIQIAEMLRQRRGDSTAVAVSDVGIIGVYSGCHVDDMNGLVDKDRFQFKSRSDFVNFNRPEYIITRGELNLKKIKASLTEIYHARMPGFGINAAMPVEVTVYRARWP